MIVYDNDVARAECEVVATDVCDTARLGGMYRSVKAGHVTVIHTVKRGREGKRDRAISRCAVRFKQTKVSLEQV